jgi:xanthine dehydrogenase molybdopterin-binding subunit B
MPKIESHIQASGEAVYTDDIGTKYVGPCLNAAYVYSTCAKGKIQAIDAAEALAMPGVVDFVCARDVKGMCSGLFLKDGPRWISYV